MTYTPFRNRKPKDLWDAITHYNSQYENVRNESQNYLFGSFLDELLSKFNEDKPDSEKFDWYWVNDKFIQFAYDYLDLLFKKE